MVGILRAQDCRGHSRGSLERRPVTDVLKRGERRPRQALADALGHVDARHRVEHPPDERQRDVGSLERADPPRLVALAVGHVADQQVEALIAVVAA